MTDNKKTLVVPMMLIGSMFAVLGFALGINAFFVPFVKEAFNISITMSYLVMTATFLSFVVFGIPSGAIIKKFGYKGGMIIAFLIMATGFYLIAPAAYCNSYFFRYFDQFELFFVAFLAVSVYQILIFLAAQKAEFHIN